MCDDTTIRDLLPGYALGCLDSEEEAPVRSHLSSCASCREELESYTRVVDRLARSVPAAEPPAALGERIIGRTGTPSRKVLRLPRGASWRPVFSAVAAVFVAALVAGNILQWTGIIPRRGGDGEPRLMTVMLEGTGDARGAYGTVVLDPVDHEGVLAVTGLPRLDADHHYQVWLIRDAERRSAGVFSVDTDGYGSLRLAVPADFRDFRGLGVSVEPSGGSPAPTGPRVMAGSLTTAP